jgi:hypothetical protein
MPYCLPEMISDVQREGDNKLLNMIISDEIPELSLYTILQILSITIFEKMPIYKA